LRNVSVSRIRDPSLRCESSRPRYADTMARGFSTTVYRDEQDRRGAAMLSPVPLILFAPFIHSSFHLFIYPPLFLFPSLFQ